MSKTAVTTWDTTAANNTDVGGIGIQGTNSVSNFDNALREVMAQIAAYIGTAALGRASFGVDIGTAYLTKSANYTVLETDNNAFIEGTADLTFAMTAVATLGAGWHAIFKANGGDVTIDPDSTETINGASTLVLLDGSMAYVVCTGTGFTAFVFDSPYHASATLASATTTDLGSVLTNIITISGTTTITGFGTASNGILKQLTFSGALTLTHNGTSLILPGATDIITAAGDTAFALSLGSGNWRVISYNRAAALLPVLFPSTAQTITSGSLITVAHGLPYTPLPYEFFAYAKCTSADLNYSIDDVIPIPIGSHGDATDVGLSMWADDTYLYAMPGANAGSSFRHLNKTTGSNNGLTNSKWSLFIGVKR